MTSRVLFFNLTKEELKSKLWMIALTQLLYFFALPLSCAMSLSNYSYYEDYNMEETISRYFIRCFNSSSFLPVAIIISGFVIGIAMFSYLFSKKQVDNYHSIPVSRTLYFGVKAFSGLVIFFSSYLLHFILFLIVGGSFGAPVLTLLPCILYSFVLHLLGFISVFFLASLCAILCGNLIVSGLLFLLLSLLPYVLIHMLNVFSREYYSTMIMSLSGYDTILKYLSPIQFYLDHLLNYTYEGVELTGTSFLALLYFIPVIGLLIVAAYQLFHKHPSEAAGNALAFRSSFTPVRLTGTIMCSLLCGVFFSDFAYYESKSIWRIVGMILGLVISFAIINIILYFDFRKALSRIPQLGICAILIASFYSFFAFDVIGYDTYLPKKEQLSAISLTVNNLKEDGDWLKDSSYEIYPYSQAQWELLDTFELEPAKYYDVVSLLIQEHENYLTQQKLQSNDAKVLVTSVDKAYDSISPEQESTVCFVKYTLNNGRTVYRTYEVFLTDAVYECIAMLYEDRNYKEAVYPIFQMDDEKLNEIMVSDINMNELNMTLSRSEMYELVSLYRNSLLKLDATTKRHSLSVGRLLFGYSGTTNKNQGVVAYLYPEFTEVLSFLEAHGATFTIDTDRIDSLTVSYYKLPDGVVDPDVYLKEQAASYAVEEMLIRRTYTERSDIDAILADAVPEAYAFPWNIFHPTLSDIKISVNFQLDDYGNYESLDYIVKENDIPSFVTEDLNSIVFE